MIHKICYVFMTQLLFFIFINLFQHGMLDETVSDNWDSTVFIVAPFSIPFGLHSATAVMNIQLHVDNFSMK
jgi:hypothetical protein